MKTRPRSRPAALLPIIGAMASLWAIPAGAETLDTLKEYGDAATANATSGAGIARGWTSPAADSYTITAGGSDFWGNTDHGSFLYDADGIRAAGENFSAIVLSTWIAEDPAEALAAEWGRTGIMVRPAPEQENGVCVAHARKHGGNSFTMLQGRNGVGDGSDRNGGEHSNAAANIANGSVRNTPIWLGLHRYNGVYYSTWAPDNGGTPGTWSRALQRAGTVATQGPVHVGLMHQSHNITPQVNTALFEHFSVGAFDLDLGQFPVAPSSEITFDGLNVSLTAGGTELGTPVDVDWKVQFTGPDQQVAGLLAAVYNEGNTQAMRDAIVANTLGAPAGRVVIPNIHWSDDGDKGYPDELPDVDNSLGERNLFNEVIPTRFLAAEDNFGVQLTGEIHIPSLADRDNNFNIRFHDGNDDYCYLEIDGVVLINNNDWSSWDGTQNNGATQATFDASDVKFDDGEWVSIRYAMLEGTGGGHANLCWDALDSIDASGTDSVTGGYDASADTYNPTDLADGAQVNFTNHPSDQIPAENFRTTIPGITYEQSGFGQPTNLVLGGTLDPSNREVIVSINGAVAKIVPVLPAIASANFTGYEEATIVLADTGTGATRDVDEATLTVTRNGADIMPAIGKNGTLTTIIDNEPVDPFINYTYVVSGTTTAATGSIPFSDTVTIRSWPMREVLYPGATTPPNASVGWDMIVFDANSVGGLGGGEDMFRRAQEAILADVVLTSGQVPFINHRDPENSPAPFAGTWSNDMPILNDTAADDNQYVTYCRTIVTIDAEQDRTFRISGDDGYGLRVTGATFTAVAGDARNQIHPVETSSVLFADGTGDSNCFAVCHFPAPGDYLVEFFGFEGGGGSHQEVSWTPGASTTLGGSAEWSLLGDTSGYESTGGTLAAIPASLIPALSPTEAGWATHWWYETVPTVGDTQAALTFLQGVVAGTATFTAETVEISPFINHGDNGGAGGEFGGDVPYPGDPNAGDTNDIVLLAKARLIAPADGDYTLQVRSDDGFLMRWADPAQVFTGFAGAGFWSPNAPGEAYFAAGTGDADSRMRVYLTAGAHDLLFLWREGGGGSNVEVSAAPGWLPAHSLAYEVLSATPSATNLYLGTGDAATDAVRITNVSATGTAVTLTWTGGTPTVDVLRSADLTPGSFTKIGESSTGTYTDSSAEVAGATEFFYRVQNQ